MTEKIARRGVRALGEYSADYLDQISVRDYALRPVVTLRARDTVLATRAWLGSGAAGTSHQGFPVVDEHEQLLGVVTRKDIYGHTQPDQPLSALLSRACVVLYDDCSLRDAADRMARERIGRLPVLSRGGRERLVGIITRSDLVDAHVHRLRAHER